MNDTSNTSDVNKIYMFSNGYATGIDIGIDTGLIWVVDIGGWDAVVMKRTRPCADRLQ